MKKSQIDSDRLGNKTKLLLKFNYTSSGLSIVFGLFCIFIIDVKGTIPFVFFLYASLNLLNSVAFKYHGSLTAMAIYTSILSWASTMVISLCSGGINSSFIFILAIIVLAGYVSTQLLGKIYMYIVITSIVIIYLIDWLDLNIFPDEVSSGAQDLFSLASILFSVYLLGWIFGKNLLETHHNLYRSKSEIEKRIDEQEMLLREVHHRVKNNLQTVSSLLNLQAKNSDNQQIKELIKGSQNRVLSMAMIHEMLYLRQNLSKIEFKIYVQELTEYLIKSLNDQQHDIDLVLDIPDVQLGIDTAIPLGLLINETVTNSLKYGFVESRKGCITISLKRNEANDTYTLLVSDDGAGFPEHTDYRNTKSLGLKLIHNLARQLHGSVRRIKAAKGTCYSITFKDIEKKLKHIPQPRT
ncbi:sensor histidine kinase [Pseudozobellia thermophila]|uniref:histidine kinase n=1 Tax=Pseudozobellia thermophila TaxID=192903 RepID=A0A1M6HZX9_9FLAO|nr:sensor histidine kinase [Pseudozobellia thermophila]SHJ27733.1 Two-component sensor histidine kinase, contains HisKA and HATPase domains [Pseudozobellia thermophila]